MKKMLLLFTILILSLQVFATDITQSPCLDSYRKLRNQYAIKSGLAPIVGLAGITESAVLAFGWEYGGWYGLHAILGPAGGIIFSHIIPLAAIGGAIGLETFHVVRFKKANRAYKLLLDVYNHDGKELERTVAKIQNQNPYITKENVISSIKELDQTKALCDGSLVLGARKAKNERQLKRLPHRIAFKGDIISKILADETIPDEDESILMF